MRKVAGYWLLATGYRQLAAGEQPAVEDIHCCDLQLKGQQLVAKNQKPKAKSQKPKANSQQPVARSSQPAARSSEPHRKRGLVLTCHWLYQPSHDKNARASSPPNTIGYE